MKVVCRRHIFSISHFPVVIPITSSRSWTNQDSPFLHGARARRTLKKVRERYSLSHVTPNAPARHCESLGDRSSISAEFPPFAAPLPKPWQFFLTRGVG